MVLYTSTANSPVRAYIDTPVTFQCDVDSVPTAQFVFDPQPYTVQYTPDPPQLNVGSSVQVVPTSTELREMLLELNRNGVSVVDDRGNIRPLLDVLNDYARAIALPNVITRVEEPFSSRVNRMSGLLSTHIPTLEKIVADLDDQIAAAIQKLLDPVSESADTASPPEELLSWLDSLPVAPVSEIEA